MHSFRPVFALPPCAPHPGHRSTPVPLDNWMHIALVGCRVPASAFQSTAAVHPTGTFLKGSGALAAKKCAVRASRRRSGPIRRRTGASRNAETQQTPTRMHSLHKSAHSANVPSGTNTHSRTFWQRTHPSIRKRGPHELPPISWTGSKVREWEVFYGGEARCGSAPSGGRAVLQRARGDFCRQQAWLEPRRRGTMVLDLQSRWKRGAASDGDRAQGIRF